VKQLTEKQRLFVSNKAGGCTNRDAAIAAGYAVGSASQAAEKLMAMPSIRAALKAATKATGGVDIKPANVSKMPKANYPNAMAFLIDAMNLASLPIAMRVDAAKALLPYQHAKLGETGKKEAANEKARKIARGRHKFATKQPPQLTVVRND
jgi:phage terminase small subunit